MSIYRAQINFHEMPSSRKPEELENDWNSLPKNVQAYILEEKQKIEKISGLAGIAQKWSRISADLRKKFREKPIGVLARAEAILNGILNLRRIRLETSHKVHKAKN